MLYFAYQIFKCKKMNTVYASTLVLSNFLLKINFLIKKKQGMESKNTMGMNDALV